MSTDCKSTRMLFVILFAALVAILPLLWVFPPTHHVLSPIYYRAKIRLIDWEFIRYDHPMSASMDRLSAFNSIAETGQVFRLDYTFDRALNSQERLSILRSTIPKLHLQITTGKQSEVLLFADTTETMQTWKSYLNALNVELNAVESTVNSK